MLVKRILSAEVLDNGLGLPRRQGALVIQSLGDEQRIVAIDDRDVVLQNFPGVAEESVGFAISPPPVNACVDALGLDDRSILSFKASLTAALARKQRVFGLLIDSDSLMRDVVQYPQLQGVAYWHVSSVYEYNDERLLSETISCLRDYRSLERPAGMRVGLACSSDMNPDLLRRLTHLVRQNRLPFFLRVAEDASIRAALDSGDTESVTAGADLTCTSKIASLRELGVLAAQPTVLVMSRVSEEDVRSLQREGCPVVYCPGSSLGRTALQFPWSLYAKHAVSVAFGTGKYVAGASLLVEQEVQAARQIHGEAAESRALVWSAVKGGYRALGMSPARFVRGDSAEQVYCWQQLIPVPDKSLGLSQ